MLTVPSTRRDVWKRVKKVVYLSKSNDDIVLKYVLLKKSSVKLGVFADASFASNPDLSSQIWYIVELTDDTGKSNVIHYSCVKSKRVTRSLLASELFAAIHALDFSSTLRVKIDDIF